MNIKELIEALGENVISLAIIAVLAISIIAIVTAGVHYYNYNYFDCVKSLKDKPEMIKYCTGGKNE